MFREGGYSFLLHADEMAAALLCQREVLKERLMKLAVNQPVIIEEDFLTGLLDLVERPLKKMADHDHTSLPD